MNDFLMFGVTSFFILMGIAFVTRASGVGNPKSELSQCISECKSSFYQNDQIESRLACIQNLCSDI